MVTDLLNPANLIKDITSGSLHMAKSFINVMFILIRNLGKFIVNNVIGTIVNKVFGWDFKHKSKNNKDADDAKCYKTDKGEVPINILIATILLPPLGVFMRFGLISWVNILITGSLTMLFYVQGLIYALVLIYS